MFCVCECKKIEVDETHFNDLYKEKYCQDCGEMFKGIERPIIGVWVERDAGDQDTSSSDWIDLTELKKLLKEA